MILFLKIYSVNYYWAFHLEMSTAFFLKIGNGYIKHDRKLSKQTGLRRFKSFFGITPSVCSIIWDSLKNKIPAESAPKHLLWCLLFLKQYSVEHIRHTILNADEKTIRKWTWFYVKLLADLNVVNIFVFLF